MKKILLSLFALGAMFTFVTPAAAQIENADGSFTYRIRGYGNVGGLNDDFVLIRYYDEDSQYYSYYKQMTSADYMLNVKSSYYFSAPASWTYAPTVSCASGGSSPYTLTFECLDEDYVISSIGFYPYKYYAANFTITAENGQSFAVNSESAGYEYGEDVIVKNINKSSYTLKIEGAAADGSGINSWYIIDTDGNGDVYEMDEAGTLSGITVVEATAGIKDVQAKKQNDGRIFDVQGREVLNPTKGLYIQNGKKFMVK